MTSQSTDPRCDFCAIAAGSDNAAEIICEADQWVAFFPLNPATPGHTLVVPRSHVRDLWELEPPLTTDLLGAAVRVGRAISSAVQPEGMNLITSAGSAAEQTIFHLHLHVVPRWTRDGFGQIWPTGHTFEDADMHDLAQRVRLACD